MSNTFRWNHVLKYRYINLVLKVFILTLKILKVIDTRKKFGVVKHVAKACLQLQVGEK
jgi:hypothetical protein